MHKVHSVFKAGNCFGSRADLVVCVLTWFHMYSEDQLIQGDDSLENPKFLRNCVSSGCHFESIHQHLSALKKYLNGVHSC